jgi:hypothetical protein
MKSLILIFISALSLSAFSAPVDGEVYYKLPSGELATRLVTLDVPSRGQGEVILSGKNFEWKTTKFKSFTKAGQTLFIAAFNTTFQNFKSTVILKGTYLKGSNQIKYYGDMYKKDGHLPANKNIETDIPGIKYTGGFSFNYLR